MINSINVNQPKFGCKKCETIKKLLIEQGARARDVHPYARQFCDNNKGRIADADVVINQLKDGVSAKFIADEEPTVDPQDLKWAQDMFAMGKEKFMAMRKKMRQGGEAKVPENLKNKPSDVTPDAPFVEKTTKPKKYKQVPEEQRGGLSQADYDYFYGEPAVRELEKDMAPMANTRKPKANGKKRRNRQANKRKQTAEDRYFDGAPSKANKHGNMPGAVDHKRQPKKKPRRLQ